MIFIHLLCGAIVLFFIGFVIELLRGRFKIEVINPATTQTQPPAFNYGQTRPRRSRIQMVGLYGSFRGLGRSRSNRSRRQRRSETRATSAISGLDDGLPSYEDSTNVPSIDELEADR